MRHLPLLLLIALLPGACTTTPEPSADPALSAQEMERLAYGGRLFDMWYDEIGAKNGEPFWPDNPETEADEGRGGPNGDGTLNDVNGEPMPNTGHAYRFKNLFGWDMRGDAGIYGRNYQAKEWVLASGPLSPANAGASRAQWIEHVTNGWQDLPRYGDVLSTDDIAALVDYMLAVRDRRLPYPDDLYPLSTEARKGFVMAPGGNIERGRAFYDRQCADCHGADATKIIFDNGEQSLGQHARYYGYAVAMITLAGEPGSDMGPQLPAGLGPQAQTTLLLDLIAALCDRDRYPRGAGADPDVPDDDIRCGAALR